MKELTLHLQFKSDTLTKEDLEQIRENITDYIFEEMKDHFIETYFTPEEIETFFNNLEDSGGTILDIWYYTNITKANLHNIPV